MTTLKLTAIKVGDWVSGTTLVDEKFIGFVLTMNVEGHLKVWATQSDHEEIVGTAIHTKLAKVKRLPEQKPTGSEEVQSLIELALDTHDKEWFEELHASFNIAPAKSKSLLEGFKQTTIKGRF